MGNVDLKALIATKRTLLGAGIVTLAVGVKLLLSFFFPGLKTSGELVLSGLLLLIYSAKTFLAYRSLREHAAPK